TTKARAGVAVSRTYPAAPLHTASLPGATAFWSLPQSALAPSVSRLPALRIATPSSSVLGSPSLPDRSGPHMPLRFRVRAGLGARAICPPTDFERLLSRATSQPFTTIAMNVARGDAVYAARAPRCVNGIA